ncbi:uncharacterized protein ACNLHF_009363 [Anomaloglossus baeobatrachus]|uniref:uncharacterized protein LOC142303862 n=1 Tax=Anomaloglossus baeobatrachus TaxID=238106 RepID=UPI003F504784
MSYNSEEFVRELIELYRTLPCLWLVKSPDYSNKHKKRKAYEKLIALCRQHHPCEKVDVSMVRKKIQALRTVYKKELNKVEKSKKSGAGTDGVYVPSLWYYDLLDFTRNQELPRASLCSFEPTTEQDPEIQTDSPDGDHCHQALSTQTSVDIPSHQVSVEEGSGEATEDNAPSTLPEPQRLSSQLRRKAATASSSEELIFLANRILHNQVNAGMDFFASLTADRLRKLDATQRSHAERIILETLSQAAAGNLDETTTLSSKAPGSQYSWPQMPDTLHSPPVRRIGPPQNVCVPPSPECSFLP